MAKKKQKIISLRKAIKVFPSPVTRVRPHDLINFSISKKQFLTDKESKKLQNFAAEVRDGEFGVDHDLLVTRKGRKLKFIPF